jgi:hypothetical protein
MQQKEKRERINKERSIPPPPAFWGSKRRFDKKEHRRKRVRKESGKT